MVAQVVCEIYRFTNSTRDFNTVCTITYYGDNAFIQGMCGEFNRNMWVELYQYFKHKGVRQVKYFRDKGDYMIEKVVEIG